MLDTIVRVKVGQVERIRLVTAIEHVRGVVRNEEAERRREIVRLVDEPIEVPERDVASRTR